MTDDLLSKPLKPTHGPPTLLDHSPLCSGRVTLSMIPIDPSQTVSQLAFYAKTAIEWFAPTHIVAMLSGGNDSAAHIQMMPWTVDMHRSIEELEPLSDGN